MVKTIYFYKRVTTIFKGGNYYYYYETLLFWGKLKKKHPGTFMTGGQRKAALNNCKHISV